MSDLVAPSPAAFTDAADIEAILAVPSIDPDEVERVVANNAASVFSWDYSLARPALRKLY